MRLILETWRYAPGHQHSPHRCDSDISDNVYHVANIQTVTINSDHGRWFTQFSPWPVMTLSDFIANNCKVCLRPSDNRWLVSSIWLRLPPISIGLITWWVNEIVSLVQNLFQKIWNYQHQRSCTVAWLSGNNLVSKLNKCVKLYFPPTMITDSIFPMNMMSILLFWLKNIHAKSTFWLS